MRWSRNLHKGRRGQWESARRETRGEARRQKCVLRANRASLKLSSLADTARALMHATPAQQGPASHLKSTLWNWAALGPRKPPPPCRVCPAGWREGGDRQLAECGPRTISTRGLLHNGATGSRGKHAGSAETAEANSACSATLIGQLAPRQSGPQVASTLRRPDWAMQVMCHMLDPSRGVSARGCPCIIIIVNCANLSVSDSSQPGSE